MSAIDDAELVLDEAFGRMGTRPLNYYSSYHFAIRKDVLELIEEYPRSLRVRIKDFTYDDGRTQNLIVISGTVPMMYKEAKYNLPLLIWLPERYPDQAPIAYVNPTKDMKVNPECNHVDNSGRIISDSLRNWDYPASTLCNFVGILRIDFAGKPPLYQKRPGDNNRPTPTPSNGPGGVAGLAAMGAALHAVNPLAQRPQSGSSIRPAQPPVPPPAVQNNNNNPGLFSAALQSHNSSGMVSGGSAGAPGGGSGGYALWGPPQPPPPPPPPQVGPSLWQGVTGLQTQQQQQQLQQQQLLQQQQQQNQQAHEAAQRAAQQEREAAYRIALSTTLAARLASSLDAGARSDLERQTTIQTELRARETSLAAEVSRLQTERQRLDGAAHELAAASSALDRWLAENEPKVERLRAASAGNGLSDAAVDPGEAIVAADILSQQALKAQAFDLATEDAMSALDRALEMRKVPLDAYLRQVRGLSRRQFTARAVSSKIAAKQASERPTARPARASNLGGGAAGAGSGPSTTAPAQLPIGDSFHSTGGILMNPLAAAAGRMRIG